MTETVETQQSTDAPVVTQVPAATAPPVSAEEFAAIKAEAEKWKTFSRKNEDKFKATSDALQKQQALLTQLAEKAGISTESAADPLKLAEQLGQAQQNAARRAVELAVFKAASASGANADALLDSNAFLSKTSTLDPADPDLGNKIAALIGEAVTANPNFKAATANAPAQQQAPQIPTTNGADFSGAPATMRQWGDEDVSRATPEELSKAISQGLLGNMGIGRGKKGYR